MVDSEVDIVLRTDEVVSFLTEREDCLLIPFLHPPRRPSPYIKQVVILRTSTHSLFPVLPCVVVHLRGVDWQECECVCSRPPGRRAVLRTARRFPPKLENGTEETRARVLLTPGFTPWWISSLLKATIHTPSPSLCSISSLLLP